MRKGHKVTARTDSSQYSSHVPVGKFVGLDSSQHSSYAPMGEFTGKDSAGTLDTYLWVNSPR